MNRGNDRSQEFKGALNAALLAIAIGLCLALTYLMERQVEAANASAQNIVVYKPPEPLPLFYPLPVYPYSTIIKSRPQVRDHMPRSDWYLELVTNQSEEAVYRYYQDWFATNGWQQMEYVTGHRDAITYRRGFLQASIVVTPFDERGGARVVIYTRSRVELQNF